MKVKDLISQNIDVDVYDDYTDELGIAFVGPIKLTPAGEKEFAEVLNYNINLDKESGCCSVCCNNDHQFGKACKFFNAAAGWCSEEDYDKWFELSE